MHSSCSISQTPSSRVAGRAEKFNVGETSPACRNRYREVGASKNSCTCRLIERCLLGLSHHVGCANSVALLDSSSFHAQSYDNFLPLPPLSVLQRILILAAMRSFSAAAFAVTTLALSAISGSADAFSKFTHTVFSTLACCST